MNRELIEQLPGAGASWAALLGAPMAQADPCLAGARRERKTTRQWPGRAFATDYVIILGV
ncbi:MAG TPA: hypothetical protein VM347_43075 [Nonomuraea sp.]|nr:hypothetical protein [Nonomuraea sp.]